MKKSSSDPKQQLLGMVTYSARAQISRRSFDIYLMRLPYLSFAVREGTIKVIIKR